jgi:chemotaxis protein MotB
MADKNKPESTDKVDPSRQRKKKGRGVKLVLWALLMTAATGGLGYLSFTFWQKNNDLDDKLEKVSWQAESCATSLKSSEERVAQANQDYAACKTKYDEDKALYTSVQANVDRLKKDLKASATELEDLRKQREEVEKRLEAFRDLTDKLKAMIDSGQLDVVVRKGRMLVELPAEVMFPSGSAELSDAGKMALMKVAVILEQFPKRQFMVTGHTDNRPLGKSQYRSNLELSTARAVTVTEFLISAGLKAENLIAAGVGKNDPVASNKTSKGRQRNRRIEIVLLPSIEELPQVPDEMLDEDEDGAGADNKAGSE